MLYTIKLVGFHNDEIIMIDLCMRMCGLDMTQAAGCVDHMPSVLVRNADEDKVAEFRREFEAVGAEIQVISTDEEAAMDPNEEYPIVNADSPATEYVEQESNTYQESEYVQENEQDYSTEYFDSDNEEADTESYGTQEYIEEDTQEYNNPNIAEYHEEALGYQETYEPEIESKPVVQMNPVSDNDSIENTKVEEKIDDSVMYESCPKCGSAFVSVKKGGGLFGGNKVRYVCDACKYKF